MRDQGGESSAGPDAGAAGTGPSPVVRVEGLTKAFPVRRGWRDILLRRGRADAKTVVDRIDFDAERGEVFGILGPNGAGKTTLLKMLSTLIDPDEGTAIVAGHDLVQRPSAVRRVLTPVIADERSVNWRLTARENLRLFATLHGLVGSDRATRIDELLELVGLADTGSRLAGAFSSGMKQRLLIARALLARPAVLLLDEPTRSLDPVAARRLRAFLRDDLARREGCTILLATHDTHEALELCDRVMVLHQGRAIACGRPRELAEQVDGNAYRVRLRGQAEGALDRLRDEGRVDGATRRDEQSGWSRIDLHIPGDESDASEVLGALVRSGAEVAGFERLDLSLADLIERLIEKDAPDAPTTGGADA